MVGEGRSSFKEATQRVRGSISSHSLVAPSNKRAPPTYTPLHPYPAPCLVHR